jgi:hypothetical protein
MESKQLNPNYQVLQDRRLEFYLLPEQKIDAGGQAVVYNTPRRKIGQHKA